MKKLYLKQPVGLSREKKYNIPALKKSIDYLNKRVEKISEFYEKAKIEDYIRLLDKPWRLIWLNFVSGLFKGLGTAIGFTLLSAVALYSLKEIMRLDLPLIGKYIAEIIKIVEKNR